VADMLKRTIPRYTSYPTAPHFSSAVGPEIYRSWLGELADAATLSVYLHVPFCAQLCRYCGCHTKATLRHDPIEAYVHRLIEEIELVAAHVGRRRVVHLHWGGGTPSIVGADRLAELHTVLADRFDLSSLREHAIELDPRHLTQPLAQMLAKIGVTRASLGVQDFTPGVQRAIGRIQPFRLVRDAVVMLNEVGINAINLDLMYGLPTQTLCDVRATISRAHALKPSRLAIFGYAHVPWFRPQQRLIDEAALPGLRERLAQAEAAHHALLELGYQPIGLDHYARPDDELAIAARAGRLRRNFQGYTTDEADALLGLGASAIGRLPQGFVQNAPDIGGYARAITSGRLATVKGVIFSTDDRLRGRIIEHLMCDLAVDIGAVQREMNLAAGGSFEGELQALAPLTNEGIVVIDGHRIQVPEKGRPYVRLVAAAFDAYLPTSQALHSVAV
jgi:oxygen-independent coproporphyrinogen-3 oxidase